MDIFMSNYLIKSLVLNGSVELLIIKSLTVWPVEGFFILGHTFCFISLKCNLLKRYLKNDLYKKKFFSF